MSVTTAHGISSPLSALLERARLTHGEATSMIARTRQQLPSSLTALDSSAAKRAQ